MSILEVEKLALNLSDRQRAELATSLLRSLTPVLSDGDEGIAEALRRDAEIEAGSGDMLSLEQLDSEIQSPRG
ncbi:MAG: addiction module protein [Verrucomicrobiota bacterium]|nr:addiction module protein [Verrucomicrobiota bacterium]